VKSLGKGKKGSTKMRNDKNGLSEELKTVQEIQKQTLERLRLHFIFNTLNAIRFLIKKEPETAYDMVYALAKYIRGRSELIVCQDMVPIEEELDYARSYARLELAQRQQLRLCWEVKEIKGYALRGSICGEMERLLKQEVYGSRENRTLVVTNADSEAAICLCIQEVNLNSLVPVYKREEEVGSVEPK